MSLNNSSIQTLSMLLNNGKPSFHIAFCVDNNYFHALGGAVMSIIMHNIRQHFTFHIFTLEISQENYLCLRQFEKMYFIHIKLHKLDKILFSKFSYLINNSHYSLSIFTRLVIPTILHGQIKRILYLDADILCVNNIDDLINLDISSDIIVVVKDTPVTMRRRIKALKLKHKTYFNGGFMFININYWINHDITKLALNTLLSKKINMRFNDQDALNIVLNGKARFISPVWNYLYSLIQDLEMNKFIINSLHNVIFIHFAGIIKPWSIWSKHNALILFQKYLSLSPWADMKFDSEPENTKEMRIYSRCMLRQGYFLKSVKWYLKYLQYKLKNYL